MAHNSNHFASFLSHSSKLKQLSMQAPQIDSLSYKEVDNKSYKEGEVGRLHKNAQSLKNNINKSVYSQSLIRNNTETANKERKSSRHQTPHSGFDLLSVRTVSASQKLKKHQDFVYKIIHDLRHPTMALSVGLGDQIEQI